ncbi:MAG: hypothetical protein J0H14_06705 [Alphaproteobacteria bacterium]|nr:hypothetical protein [Alphaproteobacteria bacterium]
MAEISKRTKRLIREYAGAAHEAELHRALLPLAGAFKQWERGEHDSFTLQDLIHKFHQGAARDLYLRYASNGLEPALAHAIVTGALERTAVPTELLGHLAGLLEFYQDLLAESYDAGGPNEPA